MSQETPADQIGCEGCRFRAEIQMPPPNIGKQSVCGHSPPSVVAILQQDPRTGALGQQLVPVFPPIAPGMVCGQFEPKPPPQFQLAPN